MKSLQFECNFHKMPSLLKFRDDIHRSARLFWFTSVWVGGLTPLKYAATITIRLVFFVEAAGAEYYQQIPTGILILMSSTWGQNCIWEHVASILSVVEATCDTEVLSVYCLSGAPVLSILVTAVTG